MLMFPTGGADLTGCGRLRNDSVLGVCRGALAQRNVLQVDYKSIGCEQFSDWAGVTSQKQHLYCFHGDKEKRARRIEKMGGGGREKRRARAPSVRGRCGILRKGK